MAIKITTNLKGLKGLLKGARKEFTRQLPKQLKRSIIEDNIKKGISPVKGEGRYQNYSNSYKDQIRGGRFQGKSISPVNLKLSGSLLESFFVNIDRVKGSIEIGFNNFLADIHNRQGAGKSKVVRRMLPTKPGESFNRSITFRIADTANRAIRAAIRRNS